LTCIQSVIKEIVVAEQIASDVAPNESVVADIDGAGTTLRNHLIFWPVAIFGLVLDLWSKQAIFARLSDHEEISIIPGFIRFVLALNDGAAFSIASGKQYMLVVISSVALIVVIGVFLFGRGHSRLMTVSLGLFAGGISGNLWDRAFNNGRVRDFIDVYIGSHHWPTFNVADSILCIAVGLMLIGTLTAPPHRARDLPQK